MKEITGCAKCAEKNNRHIDAYGKVSREDYDKMRDDSKLVVPTCFTYSENLVLLDDEHGATIARIETYCNMCKTTCVYEGTVVKVIDAQ